MSRSRVVHRLEHALYATAGAALRRLPERMALLAGTCLGWFVGSVLRIRRATVRQNLERAFPERTAEWRREVAGATYRHLGREAAAIVRIPAMSGEEVTRRFTFEGMHLVEDPIRRGKGVIVLTAHFGNWEMAIAGLSARGVPLEVVAKRQRNRLFDAEARATRERFGARVVYQREATKGALRALGAGRAVMLVADQNVLGRSHFVDFFGTPAAVARGPVVLAARAEVEIVLMFVRAVPGPEARYRLNAISIPFERTGDLDADATRVIRGYHASLEAAIREDPAQYFWLHRRWKTRPDGELASRGEVAGA